MASSSRRAAFGAGKKIFGGAEDGARAAGDGDDFVGLVLKNARGGLVEVEGAKTS